MKIFRFSRARALTAIVALGTMLAFPVRAQVVINEVMANNNTAVLNEGIYPDWVELYNPTTAAVDLSDWSISDSIVEPRKFIFPAGTFIQPGEYLMVWCDNLTNAPGLHTGFNFSATVDDVSIYGSISIGGGQQDRVTWGLQIADWSISRVPDGTGTWNLTRPCPSDQRRPSGSTKSWRIHKVARTGSSCTTRKRISCISAVWFLATSSGTRRQTRPSPRCRLSRRAGSSNSRPMTTIRTLTM
jgi:hypothetical protein